MYSEMLITLRTVRRFEGHTNRSQQIGADFSPSLLWAMTYPRMLFTLMNMNGKGKPVYCLYISPDTLEMWWWVPSQKRQLCMI